jgi:Zn-dependent alcohol dehydrogenase
VLVEITGTGICQPMPTLLDGLDSEGLFPRSSASEAPGIVRVQERSGVTSVVPATASSPLYTPNAAA